MTMKPAKRGRSVGRHQKDGAPPVVEDAKLPRMGEGEPAPVRMGRGISLMPDKPKPVAGKQNRMTPFRSVKSPAETHVPKGGYPEQTPPRPPRGGGPAGPGPKRTKDGYVRLRVLVQNGQLSVSGAKFVEGPLAETPALHPGLAYEMTVGTRRVASGPIPDAGQWRSFPDPLGRPGLQGHHVTELTSYEIAVRVPAKDLSLASLSRAQITLYRWHGTAAAEPAAGRPLKTQLKGRMETVATLKGIRLSRMSKEAQAELRSALE